MTVTVTRWVSFHVESFLAAHLGIDEDVVVVGVHPHDVRHGLAAREQGGEGGKVLGLGK